jgi:hypothetical protein
VREKLVDLHGFRQTQTADSVYWMLHGAGFFHLNYPLPILGTPWSAPFEFPLFQILVAFVVKITTLPIDVTGRLLSLICALALIHPLSILRRFFGLDREVGYIFAILFYSSSQYLYWSRTFLIETFSLLLTIYCVLFYYLYTQRRSSFRLIIFEIFIVLSLLVKITTSLVPIIFIVFLESIRLLKGIRGKTSFVIRDFLPIPAVLISLFVAEKWVNFEDAIKSRGPITSALTSAKLAGWNFGSIHQRVSKDFWLTLLLEKNLLQNSLAIFGLIIGFWLVLKRSKHSTLIVSLACLWLFPMIIFSNLHVVHIYYQTENLIYIIIVSAIVFWEVAKLAGPRQQSVVSSSIMVLAIILNFSVFSHFYLKYESFSSGKSNKLEVANFISQNTLPSSVMIVSGMDWDATASYYAKRYSVLIPDWFPGRFALLQKPDVLIGSNKKIGSLIICQSSNVKDPLTASQTEVLKKQLNLGFAKTIGSCGIYISN